MQASSSSSSPSPAPSAEPGVYVAVQGGAETRSGEALMVEAYIVLWLILMGWLFMLWRKQARIHQKLDALEAVLDAAARKPASSSGKA